MESRKRIIFTGQTSSRGSGADSGVLHGTGGYICLLSAAA